VSPQEGLGIGKSSGSICSTWLFAKLVGKLKGYDDGEVSRAGGNTAAENVNGARAGNP